MDVSTEADAISRAQRLLSRVRRQWEVGRDSFFVTLSVGIVLFPKHGATFSELLQNADSAVYVAKESGRDRMAVYNDSMRDKTVRLLEMTTLLRGAIASKHFRLYYQPIVAMKDSSIIGYEALIRWIHPERGMIAPLEFIGFAERTGLITPIEEWVFREAFEQARKWHFDEQKNSLHQPFGRLAASRRFRRVGRSPARGNPGASRMVRTRSHRNGRHDRHRPSHRHARAAASARF